MPKEYDVLKLKLHGHYSILSSGMRAEEIISRYRIVVLKL